MVTPICHVDSRAGAAETEGMATDTRERLRRVAAAYLGMEPTQLHDELDLSDDLCMDSLAAAELLVVIEEELGMKLPTDLVAGHRGVSYGELTRLVCEYVDAQGDRVDARG